MVHPKPLGGEQWLSLTRNERTSYVVGYISGYQTGFHEACEASQDLFNNRLTPQKGEENYVNIPKSRCHNRVLEFSKAKISDQGDFDVSFYVDLVTAMYEQHPDARSAPYQLLMGLTSDNGAKDSTELYKAQVNKWPNARID